MVSHELIVDSRDRDSSFNSSCDFTINLSSSLTNISKVRLNWCMIPNTSYNINSSNNVITFFENSTSKNTSLTVGWYDANSLATLLASSLTTASGGYNTYTVTYNSLTMHLLLML